MCNVDVAFLSCWISPAVEKPEVVAVKGKAVRKKCLSNPLSNGDREKKPGAELKKSKSKTNKSDSDDLMRRKRQLKLTERVASSDSSPSTSSSGLVKLNSALRDSDTSL